MATKTITGDDTLTLFDRVLNDLADDDVSSITFPTDLIQVKTGKNRNSIYARNAQGAQCDLTLRVNRGSSDDRFLQSQLASQDADIPSFSLASGQFVKRLGDGQGEVVSDTYDLEGGVFLRKVDTKENVSGDTEQAVSVYQMRFAVGTRSLG